MKIKGIAYYFADDGRFQQVNFVYQFQFSGSHIQKKDFLMNIFTELVFSFNVPNYIFNAD